MGLGPSALNTRQSTHLSGVPAAGRRCGLDGGLHRGSFAWDPGPNLTRKPHGPCVRSPLSAQTLVWRACT